MFDAMPPARLLRSCLAWPGSQAIRQAILNPGFNEREVSSMRRPARWLQLFGQRWGADMESAIEQIVNVMRKRYSERLHIPDLAAEAFFSPFHFSRLFRRETGVAPGQYLTAVRLFEAKHLLLTTSTNVADIACQVGYCGIGTFTTRFTTAVGLSPGRYRRLPLAGVLRICDDGCRIPDPELLSARRPSLPEWDCAGTVVAVPHVAGWWRRLFVGVFDSAVPQGSPLAWQVVEGDCGGQVRLDGVPAGRRAVIAVAEGCPPGGDDRATSRVFVSFVEVRAGTATQVELRMRRPRRSDPPIMVAVSGYPALGQRRLVA
jgi:AraC family transcriptional regulator